MRRKAHYFDAATDSRLRAQAKAHGVSQSAWLRALINGHRAGAEPGTAAAEADHWWDTRSPSRRVSIYRNKAGERADDPTDHDQLTIFERENA